MQLRRLFAALVAISLLGCSSDDDDRPNPQPNPERAFTTDALPSAPSVHLRQKELSATALSLELVAKDVTDGYAIAWRLEYDPEVLGFSATTPSSAWSPNTLQISREARPGLMVGTLSSKGQVSGEAWPDTVLAVIQFDIKSTNQSRVDFVTSRSGVVHGDGVRDSAVQLVGGELSAD